MSSAIRITLESYPELPLVPPDPPEQEDDSHREAESQADQAERHDGVTADATFLKYRMENEQFNHHSYLGLSLEVAHVPVVEVLEVPGPGEHGVGAVAVTPGADAGHVVTLHPDNAALGGRLTKQVIS